MSDTLEVKLLGKDYRIACKPDEREELAAAVDFLEGRLTEISEKTRGSNERIAIMAALNLAHEYLVAKNTPADVSARLESESIQRRINSIEAKLDESLAQHEQLL